MEPGCGGQGQTPGGGGLRHVVSSQMSLVGAISGLVVSRLPSGQEPSPRVAGLTESCSSCRPVLSALPPGLQGGTGGFVPLDT